MLVLMLLALASAIVLPNIEKGLQDRQVRRSALGLAAAARHLRSRALEEGRPQPLVLNLAQNNYRAARSGAVDLPSEVKFTEVTGGEVVDGDARQFVFFPNGSSHGGSIALSERGGSASYSIRLEPLTGKIQVVPGEKL
jgi:type II secretory pathway pseudopilin PulG